MHHPRCLAALTNFEARVLNVVGRRTRLRWCARLEVLEKGGDAGALGTPFIPAGVPC
jgi:hypothetical protein